MEIVKKYINDIEVTRRISTPLLNGSAKEDAVNKAKELTDNLEQTSYIKVPFVGEFNASKSSLLNAYMGVNLLPTNITPETAVSYELYYSISERLEVRHYDVLKETATLDKINTLSVVPGDIVKVYINNPKIQALNNRGIVLVDMPGIDSGVEQHNNAILNYIQEGTFYIIVSDIQYGTLTTNSLQFIQELKKYSISSAVLVSKIDRKPESEVRAVLANITDFAKRLIGPDTFVGAVSALSGQISDMEQLLAKLDGEEFAKMKFQKDIDDYIGKQIAQLEFQATLLASSASNFDAQIAALEKKREEIIERLNVNDTQAQPIDGSVQDILDDINNALLLNSYQLASVLYAQNDSKVLNNQILSIIRPVLVNSFKREIGEYQEVIGQTINQLSADIEAILKDENNPLVKQAGDIVGNIVGRELLEDLLTKGFEKLIGRLAGYRSLAGLLKITGRIINPIVGIIIGFIPDIIRLVFGKGKNEKVAELQQKLKDMAFGQIIEAMREPVTKMIEEQRQESFNNIKKIIEDELDSIDSTLKEANMQKEADEAKNKEKVELIENAVSQIKLELGLK